MSWLEEHIKEIADTLDMEIWSRCLVIYFDLLENHVEEIGRYGNDLSY